MLQDYLNMKIDSSNLSERAKENFQDAVKIQKEKENDYLINS